MRKEVMELKESSLDFNNACTPVQFAFLYAERGFRVFPVFEAVPPRGCSCRRTECHDKGKHPRTKHGFNDGTTDDVIIWRWWEKWPSASVGIATGLESGIVVLDIDPARGGWESIEMLEEAIGEIPKNVLVFTGGGGVHLYLQHPGGSIPSSNNLLPGLDIRGDGGFVVAPPSIHESGQKYEWPAPPSVFPSMPVKLVELIRVAGTLSPSDGGADPERFSAHA